MPLSTARSGLPNPLQTCTDGLDMAIQVALNPDLIGVLASGEVGAERY